MLSWREQERFARARRVWAADPEIWLTSQQGWLGPEGRAAEGPGTLALTIQVKPFPCPSAAPTLPTTAACWTSLRFLDPSLSSGVQRLGPGRFHSSGWTTGEEDTEGTPEPGHRGLAWLPESFPSCSLLTAEKGSGHRDTRISRTFRPRQEPRTSFFHSSVLGLDISEDPSQKRGGTIPFQCWGTEAPCDLGTHSNHEW